jgi:pantoate--beta-alanine ligase
MIVIHDVAPLREAIRTRQRKDEVVAFVPTMGNLHPGHLDLVRVAGERGSTVVVSIYVNPLQFGQHEDLDSYPRTLGADKAALEKYNIDILFVPDDRIMYPRGLEDQTKVVVPELSDTLCGEHRPGHFVGVATVVNRLFNIVQPDIAVFGKKDYQQMTIIRRMVSDLAMPVEVIGVDTVREQDGLALSSRNRYLNAQQRTVAPGLYQTLREARDALQRTTVDRSKIETEGYRKLVDIGFSPDYFSVRRQGDLGSPGPGDSSLVILAAARLGQARLIDNIEAELGRQ